MVKRFKISIMKLSLYKTTIFALFLAVLILGVFAFFKDIDQDKDKLYYESFAKNNKAHALIIPDSLSFAGERVPTDIYYVREGLDRELLVNTYWHSNTILLLKRASRFFPQIEPILKKNNIPDDFKYVALIESSLMNVISPANAAGFWQFLEATGKQYGLEITEEVDERYNLEKATVAATRYFKSSYDRYKNWTLAAASYNAGVGRISREFERQKVSNYYDLYLNQETTRYLYRILALKLIYENPVNYGFYIRERDLYPAIPTNRLEVKSTVTDLINFAINNNSNYRILKEFNPWLRSDKLTVAPGKTYFIELPKEGYTSYNKLLNELKNADAIMGKGELDVSTNPESPGSSQ